MFSKIVRTWSSMIAEWDSSGQGGDCHTSLRCVRNDTDNVFRFLVVLLYYVQCGMSIKIK
jgi:hypothetical protein